MVENLIYLVLSSFDKKLFLCLDQINWGEFDKHDQEIIRILLRAIEGPFLLKMQERDF